MPVPSSEASRVRRKSVPIHKVTVATCVICGSRYEVPRTTYKRKTCGQPKCRGAYIARSRAANGGPVRVPAPGVLQRAREARAASPLVGPFETHVLAKQWHLIDPSGTEHKFRNLSHFIREHGWLFDLADVTTKVAVAPSRAEVGLGRLRPGHERASASWKGWLWGEPNRRTRKRERYKQPSKPWALRAPDGTEFRTIGFREFLESATDRLDPADLVLYESGVCRAEISLGALRPRPKRRHRSWKGWTWID